jgi:IclR family KDG regulon transcriptional repressor
MGHDEKLPRPWLPKSSAHALLASFTEGEYVFELYCVAAPIRNRDTEVAAAIGVGATGAAFEMNRERMVREVMRAA